MPAETPSGALAEFLSLAFAVDELQRWIASYLDPDLLRELPGAVSPAQFAHSVVTLLERHGLIDSEFFSALTQARPRRKTKIADLRTRFKLDDPDEDARAAKSSRSATADEPAPSREEVLTKKLEQALKALTKAANAAEYDQEWTPISSWWKEWGPFFADQLQPSESEELRKISQPPRRKTEMIGKKIFHFGQTIEERLPEVRSTLKGLINLYKPVKSRKPRSSSPRRRAAV